MPVLQPAQSSLRSFLFCLFVSLSLTRVMCLLQLFTCRCADIQASGKIRFDSRALKVCLSAVFRASERFSGLSGVSRSRVFFTRLWELSFSVFLLVDKNPLYYNFTHAELSQENSPVRISFHYIEVIFLKLAISWSGEILLGCSNNGKLPRDLFTIDLVYIKRVLDSCAFLVRAFLCVECLF